MAPHHLNLEHISYLLLEQVNQNLTFMPHSRMWFRDSVPVGKGETHMQVFEKLAKYRCEQLVFRHDKATVTRF